MIYSILEPRVPNNLAQFSYIRDVLVRLPEVIKATKEKIDEQLPYNWKPMPYENIGGLTKI